MKAYEIIRTAQRVAANSFGHVIGEHEELVDTLRAEGHHDIALHVDAVIDMIGGANHKEIRKAYIGALDVILAGLVEAAHGDALAMAATQQRDALTVDEAHAYALAMNEGYDMARRVIVRPRPGSAARPDGTPYYYDIVCNGRVVGLVYACSTIKSFTFELFNRRGYESLRTLKACEARARELLA